MEDSRFEINPITPTPETSEPLLGSSLLQHPMSNKILKWLIILACGLLFISLWLLWWGKPSFSEDQVVLNIDNPSQASTGDEAVYKLTLQNSKGIKK